MNIPKRPERRNPNYCKHFIVGVSIGVMAQPSAIAIVEQQTMKTDGHGVDVVAIDLRYLDQIQAKSGYPAIAEAAHRLVQGLAPDEWGTDGSDLVVDISGLGKAAGNLMRARGMAPITVTLSNTAGETETPDVPGDWRLGKYGLIGELQVAYEAQRLKVAKDLRLAQALETALQSFKLRRSSIPTAADIAEGLRDQEHDELVYAVALCIWRAERHHPRPASLSAADDKKIADFNKRKNSSFV